MLKRRSRNRKYRRPMRKTYENTKCMTNARYHLLVTLAEQRLTSRGITLDHEFNGGWTYKACVLVASEFKARTLRLMNGFINANEFYFTPAFRKACIETQFEKDVLSG